MGCETEISNNFQETELKEGKRRKTIPLEYAVYCKLEFATNLTLGDPKKPSDKNPDPPVNPGTPPSPPTPGGGKPRSKNAVINVFVSGATLLAFLTIGFLF